MNKRTVLQALLLVMLCGITIAEKQGVPQWSQYPSVQMIDSLAVPVDISTIDKEAGWIISAIDTSSPQLPNFAGSFKIVEVPCGSMCSAIIVINCTSGSVYRAPFSVELGCTYKKESSLFIENPIENSRKLYPDTTAPEWAQPVYYKWDGKKFELITMNK